MIALFGSHAHLDPFWTIDAFYAAAEAILLTHFRESIQQVFGDYGLGSALASFQGDLPLTQPPSTLILQNTLATHQ